LPGDLNFRSHRYKHGTKTRREPRGASEDTMAQGLPRHPMIPYPCGLNVQGSMGLTGIPLTEPSRLPTVTMVPELTGLPAGFPGYQGTKLSSYSKLAVGTEPSGFQGFQEPATLWPPAISEKLNSQGSQGCLWPGILRSPENYSFQGGLRPYPESVAGRNHSGASPYKKGGAWF
jgi:hypothetical protein